MRIAMAIVVLLSTSTPAGAQSDFWTLWRITNVKAAPRDLYSRYLRDGRGALDDMMAGDRSQTPVREGLSRDACDRLREQAIVDEMRRFNKARYFPGGYTRTTEGPDPIEITVQLDCVSGSSVNRQSAPTKEPDASGLVCRQKQYPTGKVTVCE